jgi:acetyl-CoA C-acetyltransferase
MDEIVVVSASRTAIGKFGGTLKDTPAHILGSETIKQNLKQSNIKPEDVDEVIIGCVGQIAENAFISRMCQMSAGIPKEKTALSVNRMCGSGLEAINLAAIKINAGLADIIIAGGTENLSRYPYFLRNARWGYKFGHNVIEDALKLVYTDPIINKIMGETAELIASKFFISREEQDEFSLSSHLKALKAIEEGLFKDEILPLTIKEKKADIVFDIDEHPRKTDLDQLSKLKPAFLENGTVTSGNSSGINDGAATVAVMTKKKALELGIKPLVSIISFAVAGVEPEYMGIGPVYSTNKALENAGLALSDIDVFEINEAFASQTLAVMKELKVPEDKVNFNGGAIALGHPIGATGAILVVKLINIMKKRNLELGLVSLCIGGGQGITTIFKLL